MNTNVFYRVACGPYRMDLSGKGAEMFGGRWNPVGVPAVYAASSISLAMLEILIHARSLPLDYFVMALSVPMEGVKSVRAPALPAGWDRLNDQSASQQAGTRHVFQANRFGVLLPSVVVPEEQNLVLNPLHPLMRRVTVKELRPLRPDPRLFPNP
ncbi:RES family NAD+ phosphorylase [Paludibacterium paludis]|uniref:RES domain-containing protein n=1 Tax=Paludibacterium paludis TaxID=1225769 RepID=A0A918NY35_9NEIS|nr:RES family NAD+ phosphorylase [Paludibacterium paludis]GGY05108.1 hypothetical protein GCM10011289_04590 [Paludibacterium paludis]